MQKYYFCNGTEEDTTACKGRDIRDPPEVINIIGYVIIHCCIEQQNNLIKVYGGANIVQIEGVCKEVLDNTEWVAIATCGANGPHMVATWGGYVKALKTEESGIIVIPAGYYNITEENLKKNNSVELLIASRKVQGTNSRGQGCCISGKGEIQTSGKFADLAKSKFSWARGALVITVEKINAQL